MSFLTLRMKGVWKKMTTKGNGPVLGAAGDDGNGTQAFLSNGSIRRRLLDMGLIEGTGDRCLYSSPSGETLRPFSARHSGGIKAPGCGPDTCVCSAKEPAETPEMATTAATT